MTDEIAALESRVESLRSDLIEAERLLHVARMEAANIRPGEFVQKGDKLFCVVDVGTTWPGKPWLRGRLRNKNGSFSAAVRHIGTDWKKV